MNKYLYAILKLKTTSWIKYWLYNKSMKIKGVLSSILEGLSFYLTDSLNRKFNLFQIIGRSVQDGTPTPENPIPIKNTGDNGSVNEKVQNKNLFNKNDTDIADGYLVNGVPNGNKQYNQKVTGYIPVKAGKTYIQNLVNRNNQYAYYDKNKNYISGTSESIPSTGLFNPPTDAKYLRTGFFAYQLDTFQVEQGTTATEYQAHEEQNISFPLAEGQKLMQGDYLADDGIHHVMAQVDLSTLTWRVFSTNSYLANKVLSNVKLPSSNYVKPKIIAEKYIAKPQLPTPGIGSIIVLSSKKLQVFDTETPTGKIIYELETEVIDPYTPEQQTVWNQIKKLRTYKNVTHISSEDDLPANLKIQYWKEG